jgi:hypothetical protein
VNQSVATIACLQKPGRSGLGLKPANACLRCREGLTIVSEFTEVGSGKGADVERRPKLKAALKAAKGCQVLDRRVQLDRLSRDVRFISGLMSQRVRYRHAGRTWTIHAPSRLWPSKKRRMIRMYEDGLKVAKARARSSASAEGQAR